MILLFTNEKSIMLASQMCLLWVCSRGCKLRVCKCYIKLFLYLLKASYKEDSFQPSTKSQYLNRYVWVLFSYDTIKLLLILRETYIEFFIYTHQNIPSILWVFFSFYNILYIDLELTTIYVSVFHRVAVP